MAAMLVQGLMLSVVAVLEPEMVMDLEGKIHKYRDLLFHKCSWLRDRQGAPATNHALEAQWERGLSPLLLQAKLASVRKRLAFVKKWARCGVHSVHPANLASAPQWEPCPLPHLPPAKLASAPKCLA